MAPSLSTSSPSHSPLPPPLPQFERLLLRADHSALLSLNLPHAAKVAAGDYSLVTTPSSTLVSRLANDVISSIDTPALPPPLLTSTLQSACSGDNSSLITIYTAGVALLQAFVSANWSCPSSNTPSPTHEAAAALLLASGGEDAAAPTTHLAWLRAARRILVDCLDELVRCGAKLAPWWAARVVLAQQTVLSAPAPKLGYELFGFFARVLGGAGLETRDIIGDDGGDDESEDDWQMPQDIGNDEQYDEEVFASEDTALRTLCMIELAMAQRLFYDGDGSAKTLDKACQLARVCFKVGGEMGMRMRYQQKATAQLIARAFQVEGGAENAEQDIGFGIEFPKESKAEGEQDKQLFLPKNVPVNDSDALGFIQLVEPANSSVTDAEEEEEEEVGDRIELGDELVYLTPLQQSLALCRAAVVRARNASHVLTREEMAPYVNLVLANAASQYGTSSMLQMRALLLRVTFERDRGRYLERCMVQMEELARFVDDEMKEITLDQRNAAVAERNLMAFAAGCPPRWELHKELAISFGKLGLVKSAMAIFERLEFWDELVDCHRLIGNLGAAESLIREQLEKLDRAVEEEGLPMEGDSATGLRVGGKAVNMRAVRRPRLLCVLGDVTRDESLLELAWEESGQRYARAKRMLGRMCVDKGKWREAMEHFEEALKVNGLFPEIWFTHGCACVEEGKMKRAAEAFTRVVQQTPENGEAWNNLGRALYEIGKKKEALNALMEAGKRKRDSWRVWDNVLTMATEIVAVSEMIRAMEMLLELNGKEGVRSNALGIVVEEIGRMAGSTQEEDRVAVGPLCRRLLKILGRCSSLVSSDAAVWEAYAELFELVPEAGGIKRAFECRLKQVRAINTRGDWKREKDAFRRMVLATDMVVRDALEVGEELCVRQARLHIESVVDQTKEDLKQDVGFSRLQQIAQSLPKQ